MALNVDVAQVPGQAFPETVALQILSNSIYNFARKDILECSFFSRIDYLSSLFFQHFLNIDNRTILWKSLESLDQGLCKECVKASLLKIFFDI